VPSSRGDCVRAGIRDGYAPEKNWAVFGQHDENGCCPVYGQHDEIHAPPCGMNMGKKQRLEKIFFSVDSPPSE